MIDKQKKKILNSKIKIRVFNIIVALIFSFLCLCEALKIFGDKEKLYAQLLYLGPLYLTCIVFIIALCKIQNSIKAIAIARLHQRLMSIHLFNIIAYTVLGTLSRTVYLIRCQYSGDEQGDQHELLKNLKWGNALAIVSLITNEF